VLGEPLRQIALDLDSPLTMVTARYGDTQLMCSKRAPRRKTMACRKWSWTNFARRSTIWAWPIRRIRDSGAWFCIARAAPRFGSSGADRSGRAATHERSPSLGSPRLRGDFVAKRETRRAGAAPLELSELRTADAGKQAGVAAGACARRCGDASILSPDATSMSGSAGSRSHSSPKRNYDRHPRHDDRWTHGRRSHGSAGGMFWALRGCSPVVGHRLVESSPPATLQIGASIQRTAPPSTDDKSGIRRCAYDRPLPAHHRRAMAADAVGRKHCGWTISPW